MDLWQPVLADAGYLLGLRRHPTSCPPVLSSTRLIEVVVPFWSAYADAAVRHGSNLISPSLLNASENGLPMTSTSSFSSLRRFVETQSSVRCRVLSTIATRTLSSRSGFSAFHTASNRASSSDKVIGTAARTGPPLVRQLR